MMSLKYDNFRFYWTPVTEKISLVVSLQKVSYLNFAGILNDKLAFSSIIDIFEK